MTDPRGPVFISYRRKRLQETNDLVAALGNRGVPTWRDVDDLEHEPTEATIRKVLDDDTTSGAVIWLTPDVGDSPIIRDVEVPLAVTRNRRDEAFHLTIVLADGLEYDEVSQIFATSLGIHDLSTWNLTKVDSPWATAENIEVVANSVLDKRLQRILRPVPPPPAATINVHAKGTMVASATDDLGIDWTHHFAYGPPSPEGWTVMARAAHHVSARIKKLISPDTEVSVTGTASVPAATLLGSTYSRRDSKIPHWLQKQPDGQTTLEVKAGQAKNASIAKGLGWAAQPLVFRDTTAQALAVTVNISADVSEGFARSHQETPTWRAVLEISNSEPRNTRADPLAADEIASLVHLTIDAIREARSVLRGISSVHLFIAGPVSYAFLLGTAIATLPPITVYEFDTTSGAYTAGPTLMS